MKRIARRAALAWPAVITALFGGCALPDFHLVPRESTIASDAGPAPDPATAVRCTIVVATKGNDEGPGTEALPLATLERAVAVAMPGATVCVRGGVYRGDLWIRTSGRPDAPITLRNYPGETPIIDGEGRTPLGLVLYGGSDRDIYGASRDAEVGWWTIEGLEIRNIVGEAIVLRGVHDATFRLNHVHDNGGSAFAGTGARVVIDGNRIVDNGKCTPDCNVDSTGIGCTGSEFTITNDVIVGNSGFGINAAGHPCAAEDPLCQAHPEYAAAQNWRIANNLIAAQRTASGIIFWKSGAKGSVVANNVFYRNSSNVQGISFFESGGDHVVRSNLFFGDVGQISISATTADSYTETNRIEADPRFTDAAGRDFHLLPGSPAIDVGTPNGAPDHDLDGAQRPRGAGFDLGVFEQ